MRTFIEWLISISIFCLEKPSSGKVGLRSKENINSKQRLKFVFTPGCFTFAISIILKWRIRKREELALAQNWSFRFKLMYLLHVFACVGWRKLALCYIKFLYSCSARFLPLSNSPWVQVETWRKCLGSAAGDQIFNLLMMWQLISRPRSRNVPAYYRRMTPSVSFILRLRSEEGPSPFVTSDEL